MSALGNLMYTPHPADQQIRAFVPESLVTASMNDFEVSFNELLEMRRVIACLSDEVISFRPDLIPFFATGGIPFAIPLMHVLFQRGERHYVRGKHFHMFPGLSWPGLLDGRTSIAYFAKEFGDLVASLASEERQIRTLSFDATFTGNAVRALLNALYQALGELRQQPRHKPLIRVIAVIDASRADQKWQEGKLKLITKHGDFYLEPPGDFEPQNTILHDGHAMSFSRRDKQDLFGLEVVYASVSKILTEDRTELVGAESMKQQLGISQINTVGRLTIRFDNGMSVTGTGGNSVSHRLLGWLAYGEDQLPWIKWIETDRLPRLAAEELADNGEAKRLSLGGLTIYETLIDYRANAENVADALAEKKGLLSGAEVWSLLQHAYAELSKSNVSPESIPRNLQRKVMASAFEDASAVNDALNLVRVCNPDKAANEPSGLDPESALTWWKKQLPKDRSRKRRP